MFVLGMYLYVIRMFLVFNSYVLGMSYKLGS